MILQVKQIELTESQIDSMSIEELREVVLTTNKIYTEVGIRNEEARLKAHLKLKLKFGHPIKSTNINLFTEERRRVEQNKAILEWNKRSLIK